MKHERQFYIDLWTSGNFRFASILDVLTMFRLAYIDRYNAIRDIPIEYAEMSDEKPFYLHRIFTPDYTEIWNIRYMDSELKRVIYDIVSASMPSAAYAEPSSDSYLTWNEGYVLEHYPELNAFHQTYYYPAFTVYDFVASAYSLAHECRYKHVYIWDSGKYEFQPVTGLEFA